MAKRDTTEEPLTSLQAAMTAVDNGENPLQSDGNDFAEPQADAWNRTVFATKRMSDEDYAAIKAAGPSSTIFGAIPATDHDTLTAQAAAEKIVKGEDLFGLDATLSERRSTHGNYEDHARITQSLKKVIALELNEREYRGQPPLTDRQRESIDMILHKIGRAVAGDSNFADHWFDIQGYAKIAVGEIK